jgi:SAM-dependent methyltransferase
MAFNSHSGYCPICETNVRFLIRDKWLRDNYLCSNCNSIPRYRALIDTIKTFYPNFHELSIHESSPNRAASSRFLKAKCKGYTASQYFADVPRGEYRDGYRSEDLSQLTFDDNSFHLIVTQDVFEHVMAPELAFSEIARVLKPGGAHIFSMPWYPKINQSVRRADIKDGQIIYLSPAVYHGNPVDREKGSLVTFDWGLDFTDIIFKSSGLTTTIYRQRDRHKGIDGEFLEIFISRKGLGTTRSNSNPHAE